MSLIRYRIAAQDPHAHIFEVLCTLDDPSAQGQRFRLPTWTPGSYLIREFARHVIDVRAESNDGAVAMTKETKDTWRAAPCRGPLTVIARIYAFDLSVRTAYLDSTRGYFNGASVFLYPVGRENDRCTLHIDLSPEDAKRGWRIATTLPRDDRSVDHHYIAANYDELIDHPVEISDFLSASFVAGGVQHDIALIGERNVDLDRLARDLALVCQKHIDLFGGPAPFERYLYLINAVAEGQGGLEHRSSTSLLCRRNSLPTATMTQPNDDYVALLGLASHEYFHAWNVKRIKPAAFVTFDLSREAYTQQLWVFEGITSYYDDLALVRCGAITTAQYLEVIGRAITSLLRTPGRKVQSIADASFDAWIKYYRQDESTPNVGISYYLKGSLVALALDLTLRAQGRTSLDAVTRILWQRYGETGIGVPEDGIDSIANELAGTDLHDFFARFVHGTEDPPLAELLQGCGVALHLRATIGALDRGGKPATNGRTVRCTLGAKLTGDLKLQHVYSGGSAERAGLAPGDTLVAFDGLKASSEGLATLLERRAPGERIRVHAFRRDELRMFDVELDAVPLDTCYLTLIEDATPQMLRRRAEWLGEHALGMATRGPRD